MAFAPTRAGRQPCAGGTGSLNHAGSQALRLQLPHTRVSKKPKSQLRFGVRSFTPANSTAFGLKAAKCQLYTADSSLYHSTQGERKKKKS